MYVTEDSPPIRRHSAWAARGRTEPDRAGCLKRGGALSRRELIEGQIADLGDELVALKARWEEEKRAIDGIREIQARQEQLQLEMDPERPLVVAGGEVSREHGFDLVAGAAIPILKNHATLVVEP